MGRPTTPMPANQRRPRTKNKLFKCVLNNNNKINKQKTTAKVEERKEQEHQMRRSRLDTSSLLYFKPAWLKFSLFQVILTQAAPFRELGIRAQDLSPKIIGC